MQQAQIPQLDFLDDKQKLFIWLYFPYDVDDIDKTLGLMLGLGRKYSISNTILFRKTIEYLNIKGYPKEEIIKKLEEHGFIYNHNIAKTHETIDEIISNPTHDLDVETLEKLINLTNLYICKGQGNCDHSGYPLVDEENGRPRMGWCVCYFEGCFKKFWNADELRVHLKDLGKYKYGFHVYHEAAVVQYKITPEKIIDEKITKCPSIVCDKANYDFTPEELCEHLTLLGIDPFWKPGMKVIPPPKKIEGIFDKIYVGDECLICMEEDVKPSVLLLPCNHCCMCVKCYKKSNKCPICRKEIVNAVPI